MASIRVRRGSISSVGVRIGQSTGTKLVNSSSFSIGNLSSINDIDASSRSSTNSILMYNTSTQKYEHVSPYHVVDMSDSTQDNAMDAGTF
tara:strand:+ start:6783 stop:7052 length:270 start_codon:yes stop_codon:yes gene_type:complete